MARRPKVARLAALERLHLLRTALALDASRGEHLAQLLRLHALAVDLALLCERAAHEQRGHEARRESHRLVHGERRPNSRTFAGGKAADGLTVAASY